MLNKLKHPHLKFSRLHTSYTRPTASIVTVYERYTGYFVKRPDHVSLVPCCFHSEHTPSLALYPQNNSFYCFGCQKHGDTLSFIQLMELCTYKEAALIIKSL